MEKDKFNVKMYYYYYALEYILNIEHLDIIHI